MSTAVQHLRFVYCQLKSPKSSPVSITRSLDFTIKCPSASYIQKRKEILIILILVFGFVPFFKVSDSFHFGLRLKVCAVFTLPTADLPNSNWCISRIHYTWFKFRWLNQNLWLALFLKNILQLLWATTRRHGGNGERMFCIPHPF